MVLIYKEILLQTKLSHGKTQFLPNSMKNVLMIYITGYITLLIKVRNGIGSEVGFSTLVICWEKTCSLLILVWVPYPVNFFFSQVCLLFRNHQLAKPAILIIAKVKLRSEKIRFLYTIANTNVPEERISFHRFLTI